MPLTLSGFICLWALLMVFELCIIMAVMRFMALLAWIWATDSSAMSAAWSICLATASFASSTFAFCSAWAMDALSPFLIRFVICLRISPSAFWAFAASRRACLAEKRAWNSVCMSRASWR